MTDILRARITFETDMPGPDDRGLTLDRLWQERREIDWRIATERIPRSTVTNRTHHACTLTRVTAGEQDGVPIAVVRLAIDIETNGEDPVTKARRVLDMPHDGPRLERITPEKNVFGYDRHIETITGRSVIGPMPDGWLSSDEGSTSRVTDYSHHLGSYGAGGVGLSGWQINGGSWVVLPLMASDGWITLTHETTTATPDRQQMLIVVDQRIVGVHPDQRPDFPPWEHRYGGHDTVEDMPSWKDIRPQIQRFARDADGFVLEAGDGGSLWRFEMSPQLPRPIHAGSRKERLLYEGEDIGASFILTHDCYLDV